MTHHATYWQRTALQPSRTRPGLVFGCMGWPGLGTHCSYIGSSQHEEQNILSSLVCSVLPFPGTQKISKAPAAPRRSPISTPATTLVSKVKPGTAQINPQAIAKRQVLLQHQLNLNPKSQTPKPEQTQTRPNEERIREHYSRVTSNPLFCGITCAAADQARRTNLFMLGRVDPGSPQGSSIPWPL